jgi:phosphopantothenoylcysteine decarboxylase/phosphopantothenate--cysteine ligase
MKADKKISVLVTAGPTREYLDPVRYISNESSGTMGFALAEAAAKLGLKTTLISGPVNLETPKGVTRIDVVSAAQMHAATLKHAKSATVIIMAAAVADFSPEKRFASKIKKESGESSLRVELKKNPDVLKKICSLRKKGQTIIGFALETEQLIKNAKKKLLEKKCDVIVANSHAAMSSQSSVVTIITSSGHVAKFPNLPKSEIARIILAYAL